MWSLQLPHGVAIHLHISHSYASKKSNHTLWKNGLDTEQARSRSMEPIDRHQSISLDSLIWPRQMLMPFPRRQFLNRVKHVPCPSN